MSEINAGLLIQADEIRAQIEEERREAQMERADAKNRGRRLPRLILEKDTPTIIRMIRPYDDAFKAWMHFSNGENSTFELCHRHYSTSEDEVCPIDATEHPEYGKNNPREQRLIIVECLSNIGATVQKSYNGTLYTFKKPIVNVLCLPLGRDKCIDDVLKDADRLGYLTKELWLLERKSGASKGLQIPKTISREEAQRKLGAGVSLDPSDYALEFSSMTKKDYHRWIFTSLKNFPWERVGLEDPCPKPEESEKSEKAPKEEEAPSGKKGKKVRDAFSS